MLKRVHTWLEEKNRRTGSDFRDDLAWSNTRPSMKLRTLVRGQRMLVDGGKG